MATAASAISLEWRKRGSAGAPLGAGDLATRSLLAIAVIAFITSMADAYERSIAVTLASQNYSFNEVSFPVRVATWAFALAPLAWLRLTIERPSHFFHLLLYVVLYVPACTFPTISGGLDSVDYLWLNVWLMVAFAILTSFAHLHAAPLVNTGVPVGRLSVWLAVIASLGALFIGFSYGFSMNFHSFDAVYVVRFDMREQVQDKGLLARYLLTWETNVFIPAGFVTGLVAGQWPIVGLMAFLQLFLFSVTAMKGVVFYLPIVWLLLMMFRMTRNPGPYVIVAPLLITVLFLQIDRALGSEALTILFVRRQFMNPGIMLGAWYDCFHDSPKAWLGHSIFRHFVDAPYDRTPGQIVGADIWGVQEMNACGSFFADGYANFGDVGIIVATLAVGAVLHGYDRITARADRGLAISVGLIPFLMLTDGGILTALLTHGIGFLMVVAWFLPCDVPLAAESVEGKR
jgi:hypothetical protein